MIDLCNKCSICARLRGFTSIRHESERPKTHGSTHGWLFYVTAHFPVVLGGSHFLNRL